MGKGRYDVGELFDMDKADWKTTDEEPKNGYCHIVKFVGDETPVMAMYADGWFIKEGKEIEKFCLWPK